EEENKQKRSLTPSPLLSSLSSLNEQRPLVLQGEESDMSSNYILFELYLQGILLPPLRGGVGGEASFSSFFLEERSAERLLFSLICLQNREMMLIFADINTIIY
ncbi:hypothetical protein, partial [Segatella oris]|uniref:hypothetical protein n=1 Tax=Segatella oris TaxID=28135 RepID=UPI003C6F55FC